MSTPTAATPSNTPARRAVRWTVAVVLLVVLGWAGWHFGVELPERRAAEELAAKRSANARTIADLKLDLVWIAPGEFTMGSPAQHILARWFYAAREKLTGKPNPGNGSDDDERPMTRVTLTRPFWLGRTEVTQAQWTAVMGSNPSIFNGDELPVECVSWDDAMEFCRKLTVSERTAGQLPAGYAFTLPTEAQWEYACRAGTTGDYAGDLDGMAWYRENSGETTHPVGTKQANAWGLEDMHGNVCEWCRDWYRNYPGGSVSDPTGPTSGSDRVYRVGSSGFSAMDCRSAGRSHGSPVNDNINLGFRLALAPVSPTKAAQAGTPP